MTVESFQWPVKMRVHSLLLQISAEREREKELISTSLFSDYDERDGWIGLLRVLLLS